MQVAALSAAPDRAGIYLDAALAPGSPIRSRVSDGHRAFFTLAASAVAADRDASRVASLIGVVAKGSAADAWWQAATLEGIRRGLRGATGGILDGARGDLLRLAQAPVSAVRKSAVVLLATAGPGESPDAAAAVEAALRVADDVSADAERRADAIGLAALGGVEKRVAQFERWVNPREPEAVQIAALGALSRIPGEAVGTFAITAWPTLTPAARSAAIDLLHADPARQKMLVDALGMSFSQKRALIMHRDPELRAAARALLEDRPETRAAIVNRYAAAVERGGDAKRGEAVFARTCAACHKLGGGSATDLGPDLSGIRHRPSLALLVDVLSPSQAIAQGYETYLIERTNGRTDAGTLADQTPTTVTLRQAGQPLPIARRDIKQITMVPQSTMPADLDKVISPAEMADLLAYVTRR
jgi:putative heme-binding domain-containing protein